MSAVPAGAVNWKGVALGAVVSAAVTLPVSILAPDDRDSNTNFLLFAIILAGLVLGGFAAGRAAGSYKLVNGAMAPTLMYVVIQGVAVIRRLAAGEPLNPFSYVFFALLSASCGVVGGAIAHRMSQKEPTETAAPTQEEAS